MNCEWIKYMSGRRYFLDGKIRYFFSLFLSSPWNNCFNEHLCKHFVMNLPVFGFCWIFQTNRYGYMGARVCESECEWSAASQSANDKIKNKTQINAVTMKCSHKINYIQRSTKSKLAHSHKVCKCEFVCVCLFYGRVCNVAHQHGLQKKT